MKLEFSSLTELLEFVAQLDARGVTAPAAVRAPYVAPPPAAPAVATIAAGPLVVAPPVVAPAAAPVATFSPAHGALVTEKPKRVRRTRAEVAAARAGGEPLRKPRAKPAGLQPIHPAAMPQAAAAFAPSVAPVSAAPGAPALPPSIALAQPAPAPVAPPLDPDAIAWIQARAAEVGEVSDIAHLGAARKFIADRGMSRYNESFELVGLPNNIMSFSPADRALHSAAMEFIAHRVA